MNYHIEKGVQRSQQCNIIFKKRLKSSIDDFIVLICFKKKTSEFLILNITFGILDDK